MWQQPSKNIRLDFSSMPRAQRAHAIWGHGLMRRSMERIGEEAELLGIAVLPDKTRPSLPLLVEWALCRACLLGRILGYKPKISLEDAQNLASWGIEDGFAAELYESCKAVIESDGYSFRPTPLTTAEMPAREALFSRCVSAEAEELHWLGYLSKTPAQGEELYLLEQTLIANGTLTDGGRTRLERARSRRLLSHGPDDRRWKELFREPVMEPEPIEPEPMANKEGNS